MNAAIAAVVLVIVAWIALKLFFKTVKLAFYVFMLFSILTAAGAIWYVYFR